MIGTIVQAVYPAVMIAVQICRYTYSLTRPESIIECHLRTLFNSHPQASLEIISSL